MRDIVVYFLFGGLCFNLISRSATVVPLIVPIALGSALAFYFRPAIIDETIGIAESCHTKWIPLDLIDMGKELGERVYGQELANEVLMRELIKHQFESRSNAPLLVSLNGMPGTGKSLTLSIILKHFFKKGANSRFFRYYSASKDFGLFANVKNREVLQEELKALAQSCGTFVYVVDEVENLPSAVLDPILYPLFFSNDYKGINLRKSLVVLMSNAGQDFIQKKALDYWKKGVDRDSIAYDDFMVGFRDHILSLGARGLNNKLFQNEVLKLYIPFLPLERPHVINCIKDQFVNTSETPNKNLLDEILSEVSFDRDYEIFSEMGCKGIALTVYRVLQARKNA